MSAGVVVGSPAVHARRLRAAQWVRMASSGGVVLLCAGAGLRLLAAGSWEGWRMAAVVAVVCVAAAAVAVFRAARVSAARLSAGIGAERTVARALSRLPVGAVAHNVLLRAGDIDHVVIGPVLVAVETKYGRGDLRVEAGRLVVGGKVLPRDPLRQAARQAADLTAVAGVQAAAVIVVSQATGAPLLVSGVWVCAPGQLRDVLARVPAVVPQSGVAPLLARLELAT